MESFTQLPKKHHAAYLAFGAALLVFYRFMKPQKTANKGASTSKTATEKKTTKRVCVAVFVGLLALYGSAVYAGYAPNPVFPLLTRMRDHILQVSDYFKDSAMLDKPIERLNRAYEMKRQMEQCQGNATCFDMLRDSFRPIIVEWNALARVYLANASGDITRKGFAGLVDFFDAFLAFNTSEEHGNDATMMQQIMLNIVLTSVSENTKNELPEHMRSITADELAKLAASLKDNNAKRTIAERNLRELMNDQGFLAFLIGGNEDINSWRNELEIAGLSRPEALIVVGSLGPMVHGLLALTRAIVKHTVDMMYMPEISAEGGNRHSLKPTGVTALGAVSRLLFSGEGAIYVLHLGKILFMSYMFEFFAPGGFIGCYIEELIAGYKRAEKTGETKYKVLLFLRALAKAPSAIVLNLICVFFTCNAVGLIASFAIQIASDFWVFVVPSWWPFLMPHELDRLLGIFNRQLATNWRSLLGTLAVFLVCMLVQYLAQYYNALYDKNNTHLKDLLEGLPVDNRIKEIYKDKLVPAKRTYRLKKLGNALYYLIAALSWFQPVIGVIVKELAPMFGAEWLLGLPQIGHLDLSDGGINYLWSWLDLATLPFEYYRMQ